MDSIKISGVFHTQCVNCPAMKLEFVPMAIIPEEGVCENVHMCRHYHLCETIIPHILKGGPHE